MMLTAAMALESWKDLFSSWEEPALDKQERLFSNRQLRQMLVPLFIEQILVVGLGLSDTFMVSFLGEAAVSGVALVDQVNLIFLYLFIALGAGGAVIVSQYLGVWGSGTGKRATRLPASCC
ncbi:MATE family efflux transporter [Acidaminococcus timonensis]|uniref:MATE family efflux transporter n=1 Tax=Acidaminococcus timonensis TaxID=1871002 RepID=UPI002666EC43|nr:MATE family efflux transporter [uncultured Acidaminococcus sp.]